MSLRDAGFFCDEGAKRPLSLLERTGSDPAKRGHLAPGRQRAEASCPDNWTDIAVRCGCKRL